MKKITKIILTAISIAIIAIGLVFWSNLNELDATKPCAFCDPVVLQTHTFYEDNLMRCLCTYKPVGPGHCLVIPKRHIERFEQLSDEEILAMGRLIKRINAAIQKINGPSSYFIWQKNGREVGQSVPHVHMHYIPKKVSENKLAAYGLLWNFLISSFKSPTPQAQLAKQVKVMHEALKN